MKPQSPITVVVTKSVTSASSAPKILPLTPKQVAAVSEKKRGTPEEKANRIHNIRPKSAVPSSRLNPDDPPLNLTQFPNLPSRSIVEVKTRRRPVSAPAARRFFSSPRPRSSTLLPSHDPSKPPQNEPRPSSALAPRTRPHNRPDRPSSSRPFVSTVTTSRSHLRTPKPRPQSPQDAALALDKAIQLSFLDAPEATNGLLLTKASICLRSGDYAGALSVASDATGFGAHSIRCAAYVAGGEYGSAALEASKCLDLEPGDMPSTFWLAHSEFKLGDYREAAKLTKGLLKRAPGHRETWAIHCSSLRNLGLWSALLRATKSLVRRFPEDAAAWCAKSEAELNTKFLPSCEASATRAISLDSALAQAYQIRGEARYQMRMYKSAIPDFHRFGEMERIRNGMPFTPPAYAIWQSNRTRPW